MQEVELVMREKDGQKYLFALNYREYEMKITLHREAVSLFDGKAVQGEAVLAPYGVQVYRI